MNFPPQRLLINDPEYFKFLWFNRNANGIENLIESDDVFNMMTDIEVSEGATYNPDPDGVMADPDGAGAGTAIAIAQVDKLKIVGFVDLERGSVLEAIKSRGIAEQIQESTITWTLNAPDVAGDVIVKITFDSWDQKAQYANWDANYGHKMSIPVMISVGETKATLAAKIAAAVSDQGQKEQRLFPLKVTAADGVNTFTARDGFTAFRLQVVGKRISNYNDSIVDQVATGKVAAVIATTTKNYTGRGNFANLRQLFIETDANVYPLAVGPEKEQLPQRGKLYTTFLIKKKVIPTHMQTFNSYQERIFEYEIYMNETSCASQITYLTNYLNSVAVVKKDYPANTPADVLDGESGGSTLT